MHTYIHTYKETQSYTRYKYNICVLMQTHECVYMTTCVHILFYFAFLFPFLRIFPLPPPVFLPAWLDMPDGCYINSRENVLGKQVITHASAAEKMTRWHQPSPAPALPLPGSS